MEAQKNVPDRKAGVTTKRYRTRFPLTSFAPIAVEVREVEPIEIVNRKGRKAIHVTPELADRIRRGDREARLDVLRALGRLFLFIRPPTTTYGGRIEDREAHGRDDVERFARTVLDAAGNGREALVHALAFAVEDRTSKAHELTGWGRDPENEEADERRDARWLADIVLDLLSFGGTAATAPGSSAHP